MAPAPRRARPPPPPPRARSDASVFAPTGDPAAPRRARGRPNRRPRPERSPPQTRPEHRAQGAARRRMRRRVLVLIAVLLPLILLLGLLGGYLYARSVFNRIEKIPMADVLSSGGGGHELPHRRLGLTRGAGPHRCRTRSGGLRRRRRPALRHHAAPAVRGRRSEDDVDPARPLRPHRRDGRVQQDQRRLQRWPAPPRPHRRASAGHPHPPLHGGRLRQLRPAGRLPGRDHDRLRAPGVRPQLRPGHQRGRTQPPRRTAGARVRARRATSSR